MHTLTAIQDATLTIASGHHTAAYWADQSAHQFGQAFHAGWPLLLAVVALIVVAVSRARSRSRD